MANKRGTDDRLVSSVWRPRELLTTFVTVALASAQTLPPQVEIHAPYVPTPPAVVTAMLTLAGVKKNDIVYDLGCGDGRIVIAAARNFGAHGIGIDINPERIREARRRARKARVSDRVQFITQDVFEANIAPATVVFLYLLPDLNLELRPKLLRELRPGTRVISHAFTMGDWKPDRQIDVQGNKVYYWVIPPRPN